MRDHRSRPDPRRPYRSARSGPWTAPLPGLGSLVGVALLLGFCGGPNLPINTLAHVSDHQVLYYGDSPGGIMQPRQDVITTRARWADTWREVTAARPDPPPMPEVDFEESLVILVAAGRMNAGDRIAVDTVGVLQEHAEGEELFKIVYRPMEQCEPFEADVYPVQIVRVPRPPDFEELQVDWDERPAGRLGDCPDLGEASAGSSPGRGALEPGHAASPARHAGRASERQPPAPGRPDA